METASRPIAPRRNQDTGTMFVAPVEKVSKRVCKEFFGIDHNASHNTVAL